MEDKDKDQYEKICYVCRRPESVTGPLVSLPGNIDICHDCMQKAINSIGDGNLGNLDISKIQ